IQRASAPGETMRPVPLVMFLFLLGVIAADPELLFRTVISIGPGAEALVFAVVAPAFPVRVNPDDTVDALDSVIAGGGAYNATPRAHRTDVQYLLVKRRRYESASADIEYSVAFAVEPVVVGHDVDRDAPGAGFSVGGRSERQQQRCGHEGLHRYHPSCVET